MIHHFTQLQAWQKAMQLSTKIHELTKLYPREEKYALVSQMRRASVSVAANIAEGFGRFTYPDKHHKYVQARGEIIEVITFLYHSKNVGYIAETQLREHLLLAEEIHKMLNGLISSMREKEANS